MTKIKSYDDSRIHCSVKKKYHKGWRSYFSFKGTATRVDSDVMNYYTVLNSEKNKTTKSIIVITHKKVYTNMIFPCFLLNCYGVHCMIAVILQHLDILT